MKNPVFFYDDDLPSPCLGKILRGFGIDGGTRGLLVASYHHRLSSNQM